MTEPAHVQAWIESRSDDPEAVSAFAIARARTNGGHALESLMAVRLIEIGGTRRTRADIETLLHASSQFYNPHKERCTVRPSPADPLPAGPPSERIVVWERDGERRPAAERWWKHETGEVVTIREARVWSAVFGPGVDRRAAAESLAFVRDAQHGLLCNPWSQAARIARVSDSFPWIGREAESATGGAA